MKFSGKVNKETLLLLLLGGLVLLVAAIPSGNGNGDKEAITDHQPAKEALNEERNYEEEMEERVREILSHVEGVGKVDVMISLKSSSEKVMRVDQGISKSITEESDQAGGSRKISSEEKTENTILSGSGSGTPIIEKELSPQIEGIVISATGGGSDYIKAEISAAMEALFHIPSHKIKVLKRVE